MLARRAYFLYERMRTMAEKTLLTKVKNTLHITVDRYDEELTDLILSAKADLRIAGITKYNDTGDDLVRMYILTYCRLHHGSPDDYDRLSESLRMQMDRMKHASGYTDWDAGEAEQADGDWGEAYDGE